MGKRINKHICVLIYMCILQDTVPFGSVAQKGKNGHHYCWSGLPRFSLSLTDTQASSRYKLPLPFSKALIWAQAQPSCSICSGDMSRTMAPITSKMAKMTTPFHGDHVTNFSQNALNERFRYGLVLFYKVSEAYKLLKNTEYKCYFYPSEAWEGRLIWSDFFYMIW